MAPIEEKRKSPRCEFQQMIDVSNNRETYIQATGINISELGIMCRTDLQCEPYDQIYLLFKINNGTEERTIQCNGIVIHSKRNGNYYETGIQFEDLSKEDSLFISSFLKCGKEFKNLLLDNL